MKTQRFLTILVLLLTLLSGTAVVLAQDGYPGPPEIAPLPWPGMDGLRIAYQRVDVTIDEQVATTHIEQLFVNDNDWLLEGQYFFPLPPDAAVSQLTMWVDGRPIDAKILEKEEARQIYDEIVRQVRDPALLEYVGRSAIQANVFPIPAHDERRIEIEYTHLLPADNGLISYVYPQSTSLYTNVPLEEQRIRVSVRSDEAIRAVYSPSHEVDVARDGEFRAVVGYEANDVVADQDFALYYTVAPEAIGLNLLSYREAGEDGFFMLLVAPDVETAEVVAKDVILVLDTSGSMEGEKLQQAQAAAQFVVDHLNEADRFNVVTFGTGVRRYAETLVAPAEAADAGRFIDNLTAVGGTNISSALLEAAQVVDAQRPTTILFLTDGLATEGITETDKLLQAVGDAMPADARIFAFGVGDDVDPDLLDALAQNHRGTTTYVRPGQAIDEEVSSFYAKVSTPVLSNITLNFGDVVVEQLYPQTLPDLFAGTQLVLTGRYRDGGAATITLSGEVNGAPQSFTYGDNRFRERGGDDFIPRLWATRAIGHLLREIRLHGENEELVQSVVSLSRRYGIITPYTSYLIEEDDIVRPMPAEGESMPVEVTRVVTESVVEEAAAAADMAAAEAPLPVATAVAATDAAPQANGAAPEASLRYVGAKTFVLRDGVWTDTNYDAATMAQETLPFASDAYFALLAQRPQLGQYFALGEQVLVVDEGVAYQTTAATDVPAAAGAPSQTTLPAEDDPPPGNGEPLPRPNMCGAALALPLLLGFGGAAVWYGRRFGW